MSGPILSALSVLSVSVSVATSSEANQRGHWAIRARRVRSQRQAVGLALAPHSEHLPALRAAEVIVVDLARVAPRALDDDNAVGALKAVRDAVAKWVGLDDGSARYWWRYSQRRGPAAVAITISLRRV